MNESEFFAALRERYIDNSPHMRECGFVVEALSTEYVTVRLPVREDWIGDVENGRLNPGIVTVLVDSTGGLAALARAGEPEPIATLDLRIDHMRPAFFGADLHCRAECLRMARSIAFVRATVWQHDPHEPIASAQLAFMRAGARRVPDMPTHGVQDFVS
ncbi:PaaI family thioesterase [Solimonas marina]|uniref:PaaI family thioesterase n=1 Tax=Solimonas marina TaxID=2714601 RepID=A0A969WAJ9_9GAMM|nr:PaaI family thioesterase [Solimonas marina]NKF22594.1 PaaI family thioesterase [Solimonas marina]